MSSIPEFIILSTGAFVHWAFKGFKGKLDDQMVSMDQRFTMKWVTRFFVGAVMLYVIFFIGYKIFSKHRHERIHHRIQQDEKGN